MPQLPLADRPDSLCILRLSAIGDITHTLPIIRSLQAAWPETRLSWVIGQLEYTLVKDIPDIEFIVFDKHKGWRAYWQLHQYLQGRRFDILLHMQMSIRASIVSRIIPAGIRLGFDRQRATDTQWLFTNHKIPYRARQHVLDSFFGFIETLGVNQRVLEWNIPISDDLRNEVGSYLPTGPFIVISPCSSMRYRNWTVEGYSEVINYITEHHGLTTVLTGGHTKIEQEFGEAITASCKHKPLNLIGETNLQQLLAILDKASVLIAPDSGPAHMATAVNTPVIGLYAATNPGRAQPYLSSGLTVNRYPEAVFDAYSVSAEGVPWGTRVKDENAMKKITVNDVIEKLEIFLSTNLSDK